MLGSGIAMWQICYTKSCRIVVSSSVGGVVHVRSRFRIVLTSIVDVDDRQIRSNEAIVKLVRDVGGPLDVELQLNMHVYSREFGSDEIFYGTAVARIFIYFTDDPW